MHLDDRLPDLVEIKDPTRQQLRRILFRDTPCTRCGQNLVPENICLADGKDAHRSCAEVWNWELIEGFKTLMEQDAEAEGDEWIPPSLTIPAP